MHKITVYNPGRKPDWSPERLQEVIGSHGMCNISSRNWIQSGHALLSPIKSTRTSIARQVAQTTRDSLKRC